MSGPVPGPGWMTSPWFGFIGDLAPVAAAAIALGAAVIAWRNVRKQIAAAVAEGERGRSATLQRELRAEARDALVDAARTVHELLQLAIEVHWMRASASAPDVVSVDHSAERVSTVTQQIGVAKSELVLHISVLKVLGLIEAGDALTAFEAAFTDYVDSASRLGEVSLVSAAARSAIDTFAGTLRIDENPVR